MSTYLSSKWDDPSRGKGVICNLTESLVNSISVTLRHRAVLRQVRNEPLHRFQIRKLSDYGYNLLMGCVCVCVCVFLCPSTLYSYFVKVTLAPLLPKYSPDGDRKTSIHKAPLLCNIHRSVLQRNPIYFQNK